MKERKPIPRAVREGILKEFNHRCAICGKDDPQVHHIDENPSNNEVSNLIPLCPNCHLIDQHNPTQAIDPRKLTIFRKYKDPIILKAPFHPLFKRLVFLENVFTDDCSRTIDEQMRELVEFIQELEMGAFYSKKISKLAGKPNVADFVMFGDHESERQYEARKSKKAQEYIENLVSVKEQIYELVVELLRYQEW